MHNVCHRVCIHLRTHLEVKCFDKNVSNVWNAFNTVIARILI